MPWNSSNSEIEPTSSDPNHPEPRFSHQSTLQVESLQTQTRGPANRLARSCGLIVS